MSLAPSHQLWLPRYTLDQSFHQSETSWYSVFQWGLSLSAWCITRRPFGRKRVGCVYSCLNCIKRRLHSFLGTYQFISVGTYTTHWMEKRCVSSWQRKDQKSQSVHFFIVPSNAKWPQERLLAVRGKEAGPPVAGPYCPGPWRMSHHFLFMSTVRQRTTVKERFFEVTHSWAPLAY